MESMRLPTNVRLIELPGIADARGRLMYAEETRHVPFSVKRIFALYDIAPGAARGGHAHRQQEQFLVMLAGRCVISVDDVDGKTSYEMTNPTQALYVPSGVWIDLTGFTPGAVCLVLASGVFDEADYIREYEEFRRIVGAA